MTDVCVSGTKRLANVQSEREYKLKLTRLLYHRCRLYLLFYRPVDGPACPHGSGRFERLLLAVRFGAGLYSAEARTVTGLSERLFYRKLASAATAACFAYPEGENELQ